MTIPLQNTWTGQIYWQNVDNLFHWDNGVLSSFVYGKYTPDAPVKDGNCPSCKFNKKNLNACRQCKLFDRKKKQSNYQFDSVLSAKFNRPWDKLK
jgi:hypothetical protein